MNKIIIALIHLVLILEASCSNNEQQYSDEAFPLAMINIWGNGNPIDTTFSRMNSISLEDSIYYLNYTEISFDGDTVNKDYELPISNSKRTFLLLKDTSDYRLNFEGLRHLKYGRNYIVYKYLFDDPKGDDEEMNYYFIPEFGFVITRSRAWGNYNRLINNSESQEIDDIFFLTEKIVGDFNSFYFLNNKDANSSLVQE